ncbi:hypothetical protein OKW21_002918 [Catalinimonas alkaloidigena]|uniref:hypothetical protein n=1 Tax=Catalinimonas alkaloidigena TaxID=1075417 RepID=UPI0024050009|nr:hypothetical protein [Catalinimonas alkaloidigena]MDF9797655.1 hypothetical protein [Catalinimonas alkaloidigena]
MKFDEIYSSFCLSVLILTLTSACDISENVIEPGVSFTKIYNNTSFTASYDPLDVATLSDSSYLVLAATDAWNAYLLKANIDGEFAWDLKLPEPYVNPLPQLFIQNDNVYFVCMDELQLGTYILQIAPSGDTPEVVYQNSDITYPLAAQMTAEGGWLIQGYNREARKTTLTKITNAFSEEWQQEYDILEDVEERIIKHLTRTGSRLPFFNGYVQGNGNAAYYYFNGFNNYTISLTFVNPTDGEPMGVMNGFRDLGFINAAKSLPNGNFALSKNSYGDNYLIPKSEINERAITSSSDLEANHFPEIDARAAVVIKTIKIQGQEIVFYATHSKSKRIMIYAYDAADGSLLGVEYLGQTSPYEIGNISATSDGGMIILGKTYVAGRFPRICLFKLTKEEVLSIIS